MEWESGRRQMYSDVPSHWGEANFVNRADRPECAVQFMIQQVKKVHYDMVLEAKKATEIANSPIVPTAPVTATASPTTTSAPTTTTVPATTTAPAQTTAPATTITPLATSSHLATSSPLSTSSALTTKKCARVFHDDEDPQSPARPPTKRPREVELPEL
ncbi:hypothetical protein HOY80DRAFT_1033409 [Tuber brumale]|nr:hypothetical protein HOY80DRAFT_1033409 [Tuber brumale]